jgi:hypothetical protein
MMSDTCYDIRNKLLSIKSTNLIDFIIYEKMIMENKRNRC